MAILDAAMGLIPLRTPLESETVKLIGTGTLYPGQPVILAGGVVAAYSSGVECLGVCMDYATSGNEVTVCTSATMTYRIKGNDNFAQANVGQFCTFVDPDAANANTLRSAAVAATSAFTGTVGTLPIQCVGEYSVVTPEAEAQWFEVRLHTLTLSGAK